MVNKELALEVRDFIACHYFPGVVKGLLELPKECLEDISGKIAKQIVDGRAIFAFGNGGSAAIADGLIHALEQLVDPDMPFTSYGTPSFREATGISNSKLFDYRIHRSGKQDDLALIISASGNSENINRASALCREKGIETVSISGDGRIVSDPKTQTDYQLVIPISDQQISEDVMLGAAHVFAELAAKKVEGRPYDVSDVIAKYSASFAMGHQFILDSCLEQLAEGIVKAYKRGRQVRVDAPDSGFLVPVAEHIAHNLKWDAFQNVSPRLSNRVSSGVPVYHDTGLRNDGVEGYNLALGLACERNLGGLQPAVEFHG